MAQPLHLKRAHRPRRTTPRPTVEKLEKAKEYIDAGELSRRKIFPNQRDTARVNCFAFGPLSRFEFLQGMKVSLYTIEARHHSDAIQTIRVKWVPTGRHNAWQCRPLLWCPDCSEPRRRLYYRHGRIACRFCFRLSYDTRQCSRPQRILLRRKKIEFALENVGMYGAKRRRLEAELRSLPTTRARVTPRLSDPRSVMPRRWL